MVRQGGMFFGVLVFAVTIGACGSDDSGASPDAGEDPYEVAWDDASEVSDVSSAVGMTLAALVDDGPMNAELSAGRKVDYQCGQSEAGSCPTVTATCDMGQVSGAKLEYKAADNCQDQSGEPITGTVVFTRNAVRDWTADLQAFQRSGWTFNGQIHFQTQANQPWQVTLADLEVQGTVEESVEDTSCQKSCPKSATVEATIDVTVSTPAPVSVDVSLLDATVTINGALALTGTVTGHVTVTAKGSMGMDRTVLDQDLDVKLDAESMTLVDVVYGIPPTCTCPFSGTATTASILDCGDVTVTFSTAGEADCPTLNVKHDVSSEVCDATASLTARMLQAKCTPVGP